MTSCPETPQSIAEVTPERVREATAALVDLVDERLPELVYAHVRSAWRTAGPALIACCADLALSMAELAAARRPSNVMILFRALYEHVVTFCWLAIDPEPRVQQWVEHAQFWQSKLHNDVSQYGHTLLSGADLEAAQQAGQIPPLANRADEIDKHWAPLLPGFRPSGDLLSLRGMYTLYRAASRSAHAQAESVNSCIDPSKDPWVIHREHDRQMLPSALAVPMLTMALVVCNHALGWPDSSHARAVNDRFISNPLPPDG